MTGQALTPDERMIAYLDGRLDAEARARFEAEAAADPALAAEVAAHRRVAERLAEAYAPVLGEPVPPQLLAPATAANDRAAPRAGARWAALAACLIAGLLAGLTAGRLSTPQGSFIQRDGALVAQGELARALSTQLASQARLQAAGPEKIGLTIRTADGRYCRTFLGSREGLAGLACRQGGRWAVEALAAVHPASSPDYRTAASETPAAVLTAVDALAAGPALDAAAERAARDGGWTR